MAPKSGLVSPLTLGLESAPNPHSDRLSKHIFARSERSSKESDRTKTKKKKKKKKKKKRKKKEKKRKRKRFSRERTALSAKIIKIIFVKRQKNGRTRKKRNKRGLSDARNEQIAAILTE